jgi:hypothetical protein
MKGTREVAKTRPAETIDDMYMYILSDASALLTPGLQRLLNSDQSIRALCRDKWGSCFRDMVDRKDTLYHAAVPPQLTGLPCLGGFTQSNISWA